MDEIDRKILEVLRKNARMSYKDIAKYVHISDVAVHKRMKKLEQGTIKAYTVLVDQKEYDKNTIAMLALRCEVGKTADIARALSKIEDVFEVYTVLGDYDVMIKIRTRDTKSLKELVEKHLTRISGINEIRTNIVFDCLKEDIGLITG